MARKEVIALFLLVSFISLASATATIGTAYNITISCNGWDCTNLNITVLNPNSSQFVADAQTVDFGDYASYQLTPQTNGEYTYYLFDGVNYSSGTFTATSSGYTLRTQDAILYVGIFILSMFFFGLIMLGLGVLPHSNSEDEEGAIIQISYLKYLRPVLVVLAWFFVMVILYIVSNLGYAYLGDQLVFNVFFVFFRIMAAVSPIIFIVMFIWIFAKIWQDRKIRALWERGIYPLKDAI